jgi:exopolysaccharide biosynthesis polyprenyl glycosylphosphotransferase
MSVAASQVMVGVEESSDPTFGTGSASPSLRHALLGLDTAAVSSAWLVASSALSVNQSWRDITGGVAAVTVVSLLLLAVQHLYRARVCSIRIVEVVRLLRVSAGAALFSLISPSEPGVGVAIFGGALSFAFLVGTRGFYDSWLRAERARGRFTRLVAIVGQGREAERVIELLRHHPELGYRACGLVGDRETAEKNNLPWLGRPRHAVEEVVASGAGGVLLVSAGMPSDDLNWLMRELLEAGLHIQVSSGLWQVDQRRLRAAPLAHEPFFYLEPPALSTHQLRLKRVVDVSVAATIVVLSAPILALCALAVKLSDGGPVLFRQVRVGRDGRLFTLLKFRTMVVDAEARLAAVRSDNRRSGPLFKLDDDPRVTRVGRLLRATSLDELPQLFNVLGGSMSVVGPRPALPSEVAAFDAGLLCRHRVPPGITGLWQLEARENSSFYAYRHLDLFYVENWSCALDLLIMAGTVPAILARSLRSLLGRAEIAGEHA